MNIFKDYSNLPNDAQNNILLIGNFDGVHKGHQSLIEKAKKLSSEYNCKISVLSFSPHPRKFFNPELNLNITDDNKKSELLKKYGVDNFIDLNFDKAFSKITGKEFIEDILIKKLKIKCLIIGSDFKFGYKQSGDVNLLKEYQSQFKLEILDKIKDKEDVISSSKIREYISIGEISNANKLLNWEWQLSGEVIHGDKRGRELGYPTANQLIKDYIRPKFGIYASITEISGIKYKSITNIGIRPMFEIETPLIETFIFNFNSDIYDEEIIIQPFKFIRNELKFDSIEKLIKQMDKDCLKAKAMLN